MVRRLASGVCRFAMPRNGFITREFFVEEEATALPDSFAEWAPKAVVSFLAADRENLLEAVAEGGRPVVNTARCEPNPGRAVVLGDAEELYTLVHEHFEEIGVRFITQFTMACEEGEFNVHKRYKQHTDAHGIEFHSFDIPFNPPLIEDFDQTTEVDQSLAKWLHELPKPAGVFTQQTRSGPYLCLCCRLLGIDVPGEIAIIGSDGFDVSLASKPQQTASYLPSEAIGYRAAELVAEMLAGKPAPPELIRVPGLRLLVRASTGGLLAQGCNIDAAMKFIHDHACEGIKVNDVVSHTQSVSRMTFHKRFVEATGMTPATAILNRRMSEARRLVAETSLSIGTIAGMCGYHDDLYFSQVFRKAEGVPPRDYRKLQLGD